MNTREHLVACFKEEKPRFLRVLRAVPPKEGAYKPHPRSSSAAEIVWLLAGELKDACDLIDHGKVDYVQTKPPANLEDALAAYEKNAAEFERRLSKVSDSAWEKKGQFLMDGKVAWEAPLGDMMWGFLFDAIHHRGQLSTYLRPMGAKVPSIYGPSADDPGM
jgi:uncharacterized damage-inducible protein DinB